MKLRRRFVLFLVLALLAGCVPSQGSATVDLTILHVNDLHARLQPDDRGRGGYAYVAAALARERAAAAASLTLDAGDLVQGTPVSTLFRGLPAVQLANGLGIDVHCLGNHEFDYGWERIADFVTAAEFDTISANVVNASGATLVPPFVVHEVGGIRIAVVGAMTERLPGLTVSSLLGPWRAAPLVATLRPVVADAAAQADMVIVLGHLSNGEAEEILRGLPEVAVVVQGHGHRGFDEALDIDGRVAVEASGYGRTVGRLRLRYDVRQRRILQYDWDQLDVVAADIEPVADLEAQVQVWEARVAEIVDVPIGRAARSLDHEAVRDLIEASMLDFAPADVAYMNEGGVRDILPEGELLARHVWNVMPFDNRVVTVQLAGSDLLRLPGLTRGEIHLDTNGIAPAASYRVVTSDFSALGWRDRGLAIQIEDRGRLLRDVIIDRIQRLGVVP